MLLLYLIKFKLTSCTTVSWECREDSIPTVPLGDSGQPSRMQRVSFLPSPLSPGLHKGDIPWRKCWISGVIMTPFFKLAFALAVHPVHPAFCTVLLACNDTMGPLSLALPTPTILLFSTSFVSSVTVTWEDCLSFLSVAMVITMPQNNSSNLQFVA